MITKLPRVLHALEITLTRLWRAAELHLNSNQSLRMKHLIISLIACGTLLLAATPARCADADLKSDLAKMQGKWKGTLKVEGNESVWQLDVKGSKTKLTVKNSDGDELVKAECDFKLEQHGKFRAFTYSNLKWLSGENEGKTELTEGKTRSSLYRFSGSNSFSTIGGFREDSEEDQWLIKWEKE
jgi:hypothetical protein